MKNSGLVFESNYIRSVSVSFRLPYFTHWGQSLVVCGSEAVLGSWHVKKALLLTPSHEAGELIWSGSIAVPCGFECEYNYYVVDDKRNVLRWETGKKRKLCLPDAVDDGDLVQLHDLWQTGADDLAFRSAFKDVIFGRSWSFDVERSPAVCLEKLDKNAESVLVQFKVNCPNIEEGTSVHVIGSSSKLGYWKIQGGPRLGYAGDSFWVADCVIPKDEFPINYRYCKQDRTGDPCIEIGANRELSLDSSKNKPNYILVSDGLLRDIPWRGAGVAIPVFSIRSETDVGVGEFLDLKLLVDWAVSSGFHLVQLLPINDTSVHGMWWDSYPYSSLSVFALHPLYLRVQALSNNIPDDIKKEIHEAKVRLDGK